MAGIRRRRGAQRATNPERLTATDAAEARQTRRINLLVDYSIAIILALVAMVTAWSGYQAALFSGQAGDDARQLAQLNAQAARAESLADQQRQIDLAVFIAWLNAFATNQTELRDFYRSRMRPEFMPAFEAWLATQPRTNPDALPSPFEMPEYQLAARSRAQELQQQSTALTLEIENTSAYGDAYLFASPYALVLFFVSVAQRFETVAIRIGVEVLGVTLLVWALVHLIRLPVLQ